MAVTTLTVDANLKALRSELAKIPNITREEARAMSSEIVKETKKAGKAAEKAAAKSKTAWKKSGKGAKAASGDLETFGEKARAASAGVAAIGAGMVALGAAAFKAAKASSDYLDEMENASELAGASAPEFVALGAALDSAGGDSKKLSPALAKMADSMSKARDGSKTTADAFARLGVSVLDSEGQLKDTGEMMNEVGASLGDLENATEKTAIAQAIFGKKNAQVALILAGSTEAAEEFGATAAGMFSPENLKASAKFDESMTRLKFNAQAFTVQVGSALTPVITALMDAMSRAAPVITGIFLDAIPYVNNFVNGVRFAGAAFVDVGAVAVDFGKVVLSALTYPIRLFLEQINKVRASMGKDPFAVEFLKSASLESTIDGLTTSAKNLGIEGGYTGKVLRAGWYGAAFATDAAAESARGLAAAVGEVGKAAKTAEEMQEEEFQAWLKNYDARQKLIEEAAKLDAADKEKALQRDLANQEEKLRYGQDFANAAADLATNLGERLGMEEKKAAMLSYVISKAQALTEIAINTLVAASKAAAQTGIGAVVASPVVMALGAVQAAAVMAQPPPKFHRGGMIAPDERSVTAQTGEAILSRAGVAAIGGAPAVNSANRGGGSSAPVVVVNQYRHRVFDSFIHDNLRRAGSPLALAIASNGNKAGIIR